MTCLCFGAFDLLNRYVFVQLKLKLTLLYLIVGLDYYRGVNKPRVYDSQIKPFSKGFGISSPRP